MFKIKRKYLFGNFRETFKIGKIGQSCPRLINKFIFNNKKYIFYKGKTSLYNGIIIGYDWNINGWWECVIFRPF